MGLSIEAMPWIFWHKATRQIVEAQMRRLRRPSQKEKKQAARRFWLLQKFSKIFGEELSMPRILRQLRKEKTLHIELVLGARSPGEKLGLAPVEGGLSIRKVADNIVYSDRVIRWDVPRKVAPTSFINVFCQEPGVRKFFDHARSHGLQVAVKPEPHIAYDQASDDQSSLALRLEISYKGTGRDAPPENAQMAAANDDFTIHQLKEFLRPARFGIHRQRFGLGS